MAARDAHLKLGDEYLSKSQHLMAVALLDDKGNMVGSVMLVDFPSRKELDDWIRIEPYVKTGVWKNIEIIPAKVGPSFEKYLPK